jgi:hypothetical protein
MELLLRWVITGLALFVAAWLRDVRRSFRRLPIQECARDNTGYDIQTDLTESRQRFAARALQEFGGFSASAVKTQKAIFQESLSALGYG